MQPTSGKRRARVFFNLFKHHNKTKTERLYHTYRNVMYVAAYEVLEDNTLAQDAIHESFERIIKNLHKIDEDDTARTCSFLTILFAATLPSI